MKGFLSIGNSVHKIKEMRKITNYRKPFDVVGAKSMRVGK